MKTGHLKRPDCSIYYEVAGSGPPLVFAHGLGGNHLSWWQQVAHFAPRYTNNHAAYHHQVVPIQNNLVNDVTQYALAENLNYCPIR